MAGVNDCAVAPHFPNQALDLDKRPIRDEANITSEKPGMFFYDAAGWRSYPDIKKVALHSKLPSLCAELLDFTYLNFWEDTTFVKAPNTPQRTSFHQDCGHFQIQGRKCAVVWIPLDPVNAGQFFKEDGELLIAENGTLHIEP